MRNKCDWVTRPNNLRTIMENYWDKMLVNNWYISDHGDIIKYVGHRFIEFHHCLQLSDISQWSEILIKFSKFTTLSIFIGFVDQYHINTKLMKLMVQTINSLAKTLHYITTVKYHACFPTILTVDWTVANKTRLHLAHKTYHCWGDNMRG